MLASSVEGTATCPLRAEHQRARLVRSLYLGTADHGPTIFNRYIGRQAGVCRDDTILASTIQEPVLLDFSLISCLVSRSRRDVSCQGGSQCFNGTCNLFFYPVHTILATFLAPYLVKELGILKVRRCTVL
jgi:hypothetical protein